MTASSCTPSVASSRLLLLLLLQTPRPRLPLLALRGKLTDRANSKTKLGIVLRPPPPYWQLAAALSRLRSEFPPVTSSAVPRVSCHVCYLRPVGFDLSSGIKHRTSRFLLFTSCEPRAIIFEVWTRGANFAVLINLLVHIKVNERLCYGRGTARRLSVEILQLQNIPIAWHYLRDPTLSRFYTIPECDRHTHRETDGQIHDDGMYCVSRASRSKNRPHCTRPTKYMQATSVG